MLPQAAEFRDEINALHALLETLSDQDWDRRRGSSAGPSMTSSSTCMSAT